MATPRPRKSLGQHFLVDQHAVTRIVTALDLSEGEPVLEIGPGGGVLTGPLIAAAGKIAAVELDDTLAARLRKRFDPSQLHLFRRDVLRLDLAEVLETLGASENTRLTIAGNLPYNISKPVAQKMIRERERVDRAVLMFQREVATRLTAAPGGRSYGPLSVLTGLTYRVETLFDLQPRSFYPRPKVVSTVTLWRPRQDWRLEAEQEQRLRTVLTVCFARRRRTLRNNLRAGLHEDSKVERLLQAIDTPGELRAEVLEPAIFLRMAEHWDAAPPV